MNTLNQYTGKKMNSKIITPSFKEERSGELKMIGFFAKKARGLMVRFAIDHNIQKAEVLQNFDYDGYHFNLELSQVDKWVFSRG